MGIRLSITLIAWSVPVAPTPPSRRQLVGSPKSDTVNDENLDALNPPVHPSSLQQPSSLRNPRVEQQVPGVMVTGAGDPRVNGWYFRMRPNERIDCLPEEKQVGYYHVCYQKDGDENMVILADPDFMHDFSGVWIFHYQEGEQWDRLYFRMKSAHAITPPTTGWISTSGGTEPPPTLRV